MQTGRKREGELGGGPARAAQTGTMAVQLAQRNSGANRPKVLGRGRGAGELMSTREAGLKGAETRHGGRASQGAHLEGENLEGVVLEVERMVGVPAKLPGALEVAVLKVVPGKVLGVLWLGAIPDPVRGYGVTDLHQMARERKEDAGVYELLPRNTHGREAAARGGEGRRGDPQRAEAPEKSMQWARPREGGGVAGGNPERGRRWRS